MCSLARYILGIHLYKMRIYLLLLFRLKAIAELNPQDLKFY